jgi:Phage integrase SAM-like domain
MGLLADRQERKVIADIYQISNRGILRDETISGYFTAWLERKERETTAATFRRYSGIVAEFLKWLGSRAELRLAHLSSADVGKFRDALAKKYSPVSVNVARSCIRAALYDAFRDGLVDVNEAARVPKLVAYRRGDIAGGNRQASRFNRMSLEKFQRSATFMQVFARPVV